MVALPFWSPIQQLISLISKNLFTIIIRTGCNFWLFKTMQIENLFITDNYGESFTEKKLEKKKMRIYVVAEQKAFYSK